MPTHTLTVPPELDGARLDVTLAPPLDKDTTGLIAVARTPAAHAALARQWRERAVVKRYWTLVVGHPHREDGVVEMPIGRDPRQRKRMAPLLGGRPARTRYRVTRT